MDFKLCSSGEGGTDGKDLHVCTCMCGSAHDCGCVVDGSNAMVAPYCCTDPVKEICSWCSLTRLLTIGHVQPFQ